MVWYHRLGDTTPFLFLGGKKVTLDNVEQYSKDLILKAATNNNLFEYARKRKKEEPHLKESINGFVETIIQDIYQQRSTPPPKYVAINKKMADMFVWFGVAMGEILAKEREIQYLNKIMENE